MSRLASSVPEPAAYPRLLNGTFLRRADFSSPAASTLPVHEAGREPGRDDPGYLAINVNGYPARVSVWTDDEWRDLAPSARPTWAQRIKGVWLSVAML